jgi:hypothetical protein
MPSKVDPQLIKAVTGSLSSRGFPTLLLLQIIDATVCKKVKRVLGAVRFGSDCQPTLAVFQNSVRPVTRVLLGT